MKEADLFEPVKELLLTKIGCDAVYAEVLHYDVVGTVGRQDVIVEMKKQLNFKVIEQAVDAKRNAHYVFVAVPETKGGISRIVRQFLTYHGVGLILVKEGPGGKRYADIYTGLFAAFNRRTGDIRKHIRIGYHDQITGGHKMGDFDYQSDYTLMIDDVKRYVRRRSPEWVTVEDILAHCQCYYARPKTQLAATLRAHWNSSWIEHRVDNRKTHFRYRDETG